MTETRAYFKTIARLSVPFAAAQVGLQLSAVVDTAIAGRLGEHELAATGLGSSLFFAVTVFGLGLSMALDPITAQAFGAGRSDDAHEALWQGVWVNLLSTLPLCAIIVLLTFNLERVGVSAQLAFTTRGFVLARLPSLFFVMLSVSLRSYLQSARLGRPVVYATIVLNVVNFVAAYGLSRTHGVVGVGWGNDLGVIGQVIVLTVAVLGSSEKRQWALPAPRRALMRQIVSIGAPVGLQLSAEVGVFALVALLMGRMGDRAMAAHQTAMMLASMTFSACLGIGAATSVQVGRSIGAQEAATTRRWGLVGIALGALFMTLPAVLMLTTPELLAAIITTDPEVVPTAAMLLRVAGVFQLADGVQAVAAGALRGAGQTHWPFWANVIGHWVIGLPLALTFAFVVGLGAAGLWWGLTCGLLAVAVALTARFWTLSRRPIAALRLHGGDGAFDQEVLQQP